MRFNQTVVYALKALKAIDQSGAKTQTKAIQTKTGIPYEFLAQILRRLRKAEILQVSRGPRGGFMLSKPLEHITLQSVVQAVDQATEREVVDPVALNLKELAAKALSQSVASIV